MRAAVSGASPRGRSSKLARKDREGTRRTGGRQGGLSAAGRGLSPQSSEHELLGALLDTSESPLLLLQPEPAMVGGRREAV